MENYMTICPDHSGCLKDIAALQRENELQWEAINLTSARVNAIMTRLNIILGGIVVASIMLAINLMIK